MTKTRGFLFGLLAATTLFGLPAGAETLDEALVLAYRNNPTLQAQRAALRATDESVAQALANWRPVVQVSGSLGARRLETLRDSSADSKDNLITRSLSLSATQTLYRGGRTVNQTSAAESQVNAARARLKSTEQSVLLAAVTAYLNVLRDAAVVDLNRNNVRVLQRQLEATQDRFDVGEVTRTDVSQAEARLAGANADLTSSIGDLEVSRATYERIVGQAPGELEVPPPLAGLPGSEQELRDIAAQRNPSVVAADFDALAARYDVLVAEGELRPTVTLQASISKSFDSQVKGVDTNDASLTANLSVPLYQQGVVFSRIRQSKQVAGQRQIEIDEATRSATENATSAWERLQTARARIVSLQAQVEAAEVALEGVEREASVGSRTVLDVLDAEQERLQARVDLVRAQRDASVSEYEVKSAMGGLTAEVLGLPVDVYDVEQNYQRVREKYWGSD